MLVIELSNLILLLDKYLEISRSEMIPITLALLSKTGIAPILCLVNLFAASKTVAEPSIVKHYLCESDFTNTPAIFNYS